MLDLKALIQSWYRGQNRFETADPKDQVFSPYDMATAVLEDMVSRNVKPFRVQKLDLTVAQTTPLEIQVPGFHVVLYGYQQGSAIKAVNTQAFVEMWWEKYEDVPGYPMKHSRGYSGVFRTLYLKWPAQANVEADLIIHNEIHTPWVNGEAAT